MPLPSNRNLADLNTGGALRPAIFSRTIQNYFSEVFCSFDLWQFNGETQMEKSGNL